jgi:hypothetical protein
MSWQRLGWPKCPVTAFRETKTYIYLPFKIFYPIGGKTIFEVNLDGKEEI